MKLVRFLMYIGDYIKSIFISGLLTIVPIAATVFFIHFMYGFVIKILQPLRSIGPAWLHRIPGTEFVAITIFIFLCGIIVKLFVVSLVIHYFEKIISRVPLVRIVYSSAKILANFFSVSTAKSTTEKKVVLIPYPRDGQYHLAFLLESAEESYQGLIPSNLKKNPNERFYKVFMPNSPNPTTGYFFIMPESEIIHTTISFEEAVKVLVSCGLVTPESLLKR